METGFLLVDKPAGMTSHDVVDALRKTTGIRKIGHAGTLDPFATGLLILAVGREATKHIQQFVGMGKTYESVFVLGATTETLDPESPVIPSAAAPEITEQVLANAAAQLTGDIKQIPPMYAAIKIGGRKLYEIARAGEEIEREPRSITVHAFTITEAPVRNGTEYHVRVRIDCSSGTYIRALARDFAAALGTDGYTLELRRTHIGQFDVQNAAKLASITKENWLTFLKTPKDMGIDA